MAPLLLVLALAAAPSDGLWHRLVGILQYLEADYPAAVESGDPFELEEQRAFIAEAVSAARELGHEAAPYVARLEALKARIDQGADPQGVSRQCSELIEELVLEGGLARSPRRPPDLERGRALYAVSCAPCHGEKGDGQSAVSASMNPKPANFLDDGAMDALTPYKAFNTISFGVTGTAMPSFSTLDEDDRWALAFYVFTLRRPPCDGPARHSTLEELATSTDVQLAERYGADALSCLRHEVPEPDEERALLSARESVERAIELSAQGKPAAARQALVDAYLNGFEPVEPLLRARDARLVRDIELAFQKARLQAERHGPKTVEASRELLALLDKARRTRGSGDFWVVFLEAVLILLREGFEAMVVLAALFAMLKKSKAPPQEARWVHAGWVSALALGAVAFAFGRTILAAAGREWLEAAVGLFAVALLLYAALWLNSRHTMRRFMGELRERVESAVGTGSTAGLFAIAFTAVFRESFETAVFLQGLAVDSPRGVAAGAALGGTLLVALVLFVNQVGYRLPMKALFRASTVVLVATAVVMLGKSLHALQEVGLLPLVPMRFVTIEVFGIHPDALSLGPQLLLAFSPLAFRLWRRRSEEPPAIERSGARSS